MKNENFFEYIKKKITRAHIINAILFLAISIFLGGLAFFIGFSSEVNWQIGPRHSNIGIPVPNFVISTFFLVVGIIFLFIFISSIKSAVKHKEYDGFMLLAEKTGNTADIEESLSSTEKCRYAKGELRCNEKYLFYIEDTNIFIIKTAAVVGIRPIIEQQKNSKSYFVSIYHKDVCNNVIKIKTTKKNINLLASFIADQCPKKQG